METEKPHGTLVKIKDHSTIVYFIFIANVCIVCIDMNVIDFALLLLHSENINSGVMGSVYVVKQWLTRVFDASSRNL